MSKSDEQTIQDFGEQWKRYRENTGYYASQENFADIVEPLLSPADFVGANVADIGSGTGRIVGMLAGAGARRILALEPSVAADVLRENTRDLPNVEVLQAPGEDLPAGLGLDFVVSIGVIHHIPQPDPVMRAAFEALKPGGKAVIWLYGEEGNGAYLALARPLRSVTCRLPPLLLSGLSWSLLPSLSAYAHLSKWAPLPLRGYMQNYMLKLSPRTRMLVIYDQLNPRHAKYYRREEALALMERSGFVDVRLHHRHGYSWTVVGSRPE